jgi:hypothetical protein
MAASCPVAGVAEWLGTGLQSRLCGFESRHSLASPLCIEFEATARRFATSVHACCGSSASASMEQPQVGRGQVRTVPSKCVGSYTKSRLRDPPQSLALVVAKLELFRELSLAPEDAWGHASNLSELGDWLVMHQGWRGELPEKLTPGATLVGVAGAKGLRNRVTWTVRDVEPPRLLELTGDGVGGTKYRLRVHSQDRSWWPAPVRAYRRGRRAGGQRRHGTLDSALRGLVQLKLEKRSLLAKRIARWRRCPRQRHRVGMQDHRVR